MGGSRLFQIFPNMKLRQKVLITLLPVWIVFLCMISILYAVMIRGVEKELIHNSFQTLMTVSSDISASLKRAQNSIAAFNRSASIQTYLYEESAGNDKASARRLLTRLFNYEIITTLPFAKSVYLIKDEQDYLYIESTPDITEQDIQSFAASIYQENYANYSDKYKLPTNAPFTSQKLLHYITPVPNLNLVTREKALLVINFHESFIANNYSKYSSVILPGSTFAVRNSEGELICSVPSNISPVNASDGNPPTAGYRIIDGEPIMNAPIDGIDWVATITVPLESVFAPTKQYRTLFVVLAVGSVLVSLGLIFLSTSSLSARLREMSAVMEQVRGGQLGARFPVLYQDEISVMGGEFNRMIDDLQHLRLNIYELRLRQREAELLALQSQINPHFLYNTLESIRMVAMEQGCGEVSDQIKTLSDMFRYTISSGGADQVYVRQELDHVYDYLTIQSFRFMDRYDVRIYVDEDILGLRMLKLVLQPLMENAFTHGVRSMRKGGRIVLTGRREGDVVRFIISDNGAGMEPERLLVLRAELSATPQEPRRGRSIGLANVNDRLKLTYGELYALQIDSEPGMGTTVTMTFPVVEEVLREEGTAD